MRPFALAALTFLGGACSTAHSPPPQVPDAHVIEAPRPRDAALEFQVNGHPFPLPLVRGTLGGHPAKFLVDTGSSSHVIAAWFARKHRLETRESGDVGTDHVGHRIVTQRVDNPELAIEGWGALPRGPVLSAELPSAVEALGIAGFISPQRLAAERDVVLDLHGSSFRSPVEVEASAAANSVMTGNALIAHGAATTCFEENAGTSGGLSFLVSGSIDHNDVRLLIDSGAEHSDIFVRSNAGKVLLRKAHRDRSSIVAASGKVEVHRVGAAISVGNVKKVTNLNLIDGTAEGTCRRDGVLGMDVLRNCTLYFHGTSVRATCND